MTDCNRQAVFFSSLGRQEVRADFAGGTLTSDGGGLLLREVDRRLGLVDALADGLTDPRDPARIRHEQRTMLAQRIFGLALGYEDLNDHNELRRDPLFSVLAEQTPRLGAEGALRDPLASSPTLCRLENRVDRKALARMSAVLVEQFIAAFDTPPDELVLDFDPTDLPVHGQQERRFFHGFYGHYCFLPLYVFCGSQLLVAYLRPSNIDAQFHAWQNNFVTYVNGHLADLGLVAGDVVDLNNSAATWTADYPAHTAAQAAAQAARQQDAQHERGGP